MTALLWLLAFALAFDFADTEHKLAVEKRRTYMAGTWSMVMYLLGIVGTWAVLDVSTALIFPTALGLFAGSSVAMRRARRERMQPAQRCVGRCSHCSCCS